MVVIAKHDIPEVAVNGQRMYVTKMFFGHPIYILHVAFGKNKIVNKKWLRNNFDVVEK